MHVLPLKQCSMAYLATAAAAADFRAAATRAASPSWGQMRGRGCSTDRYTCAQSAGTVFLSAQVAWLSACRPRIGMGVGKIIFVRVGQHCGQQQELLSGTAVQYSLAHFADDVSLSTVGSPFFKSYSLCTGSMGANVMTQHAASAQPGGRAWACGMRLARRRAGCLDRSFHMLV